jgi:hypothetical protein
MVASCLTASATLSIRKATSDFCEMGRRITGNMEEKPV